jgi:hypothetical protein
MEKSKALCFRDSEKQKEWGRDDGSALNALILDSSVCARFLESQEVSTKKAFGVPELSGCQVGSTYCSSLFCALDTHHKLIIT